MPAMKLSKESRLNGVKTNVTNLTDVAAALRVPGSAIIKWFCSKVGANSEGTSIIKGEHREPDLRVHLDTFIGRYVCCDNCKYPELAYQIKGKKNLVGVCNSCGKEKQLDTQDKAGKTMFNEIQKNPHLYKTEIIKKTDVTESKPEKKPKKSKKDKGPKQTEEDELPT